MKVKDIYHILIMLM